MLTTVGKSVIRGRLEAVTAVFGGNFYIVLSSDSTAINLSDTTLPGEQTSNGLQRQVVTFAHTTGQNTWTATATFTFTGTSSTPIYKVAIFDAATAGSLLVEYLASSPTVFSNAGDNAQWSITISL